MDFIDKISDIIIVIGAVAGAIFAIINCVRGLGDSHNYFAKRHRKKVRNEIKSLLTEILPEYMTSITEAVEKKVLEDLKEPLNQLTKINLDQNELLKILNNSLKDVLRERIMNIYNAYKKTKQIPLQKKEVLDELYKDYKEQKGNTYIDKYYKRMCNWQIIYVDPEDRNKD